MRCSLVIASVVVLSCTGSQKHAASPGNTYPCGDFLSVRERAVKQAKGDARKALDAWTPPAAVPEAGRPVIEDAAREYLEQCGRDEVVALTRQLVAFPTVGAEIPAESSPAFAAMAQFLDGWAKEAGLTFTNVGKHAAWELSLGPSGPAQLGFVMHGDVVPIVGKDSPPPTQQGLPHGWTHAPFGGDVVGDRLYGRGSEDDKGPIAASLVVLRTLSKLGLTPRERIVSIIGTGEEGNWAPFVEYTQSTPQPRHVLSLDASFPVVISEFGWVGWHLTAQPRSGRAVRCAEVLEARGGEFITQVPGEAVARLRPGNQDTASQLVTRLKDLAASELTRFPGGDVEVRAEAGGTVEVRAKGVAVHSSVPEDGQNALWLLAQVTARAGICDGGPGTMLRLLAERFAGDHFGEKLGIAYADPVQGRLISVPTVLRTEGRVAKLDINIRRPGGVSNADFSRRLDDALTGLQRVYGAELVERTAERHIGDAHVADLNGPLVAMLMGIYQRHTGDTASRPTGIRGGTYARLFQGGVSFGPALPGEPYTGHMPDEYVKISTLHTMTKMLLDVALRIDALQGSGSAASH